MNFTRFSLNKILIAFLAFLVLSPVFVRAETMPLTSAECISPGLYQFQSVKVNAGPEEVSYNAGDTIKFVGEVINENPYPVVDGNVFVRISKDNDSFETQGHNAIDEIVVVSGVNVAERSTTPVSFSWKVPDGLGAGNYRAEYFFSVGKKFNLGGLPFTNEIIIGFARFEIKSDKQTSFVLDRSQTKVNGAGYSHVGNWPFIPKNQPIEIIQPVKNLSGADISVNVNYELYYWDSLNQGDKISEKSESVVVPAGSSVDLKYVIDQSNEPVYYLKIKAASGGEVSIVNVRTTSDLTRARINYPAINNFPIKEGESTKLFSCFHTAFGTATGNKVLLTLSDKKGNEIVSGEYNSDITSAMSAANLDFTAIKDYKFVNLKASIVDSAGTVVDSYETNYDCSVLNSLKCQSMPDESNLIIYATAFLIFSLIALLVSKKTTNESAKKILTALAILLLVLSFSSFVAMLFTNPDSTGAETVSSDGRTKTDTKSASYDYGWLNGINNNGTPIYQGDDTYDNRRMAFGWANYTYSVTMTGGTQSGNGFKVRVGDSITFTPSGTCSFSSTTGAWDTPYCGQQLVTSGDGRTGKISFTSSTPSSFASSGNGALLSCSGASCTASATGNTTAYYNFNSGVTLTADGCVETNSQGNNCFDGITYNDIKTGSSNGDLMLWNASAGTYTGGNQNVGLGGYNPSWSIQVYQDAVCGTSNNQTISSEPTTNPAACSIGSYSNTPPDTADRFNWTCGGVNGGANVACSAANSNYTRTLTVTKSGSGQGTIYSPVISCGTEGNGTCTQNVPNGTSINLSTTVPVGSQSTFGSWSGACTGNGAICTVLMDANKSVTGTFNPPANYTLSVTKAGTGVGTVHSPGAISCGDGGNSCVETAVSGTTISLSTTPNGASSSFSHWSGDCTGSASTCDVLLNANKSVTATFIGTEAEGICGLANGETVQSQPTGSDACSSGAYNSAPADDDDYFYWRCYDVDGGTVGQDDYDSCSAEKGATTTINNPSIDNDNDVNDNEPPTFISIVNDADDQCVVRWEIQGSTAGECVIKDSSGDEFSSQTYAAEGDMEASVDSREEYTITCTDTATLVSDTSTVLRCVLNPSIIED